MAYTSVPDVHSVLYGSQAHKSLTELEIPISAQRLEVYDQTYSQLGLYQPPTNYVEPTIMNQSNEPYRYSAPTAPAAQPSAHLPGYWNHQQWQHNATVTDDVPTISVDSGYYDPYAASAAYSPEVAGPGTPSEDGMQPPEFNLSIWNMPVAGQYQQQDVQQTGMSPSSLSEGALYAEDTTFSPSLNGSEYLQMSTGAPRQRSASEPNLFAGVPDQTASSMFFADDLTLSTQQQRVLPQEQVYLSPSSDSTVHAHSLPQYPQSHTLRRAVSLTGPHRHSAGDAFLHPQYTLPASCGRVVRARSLGSSCGGSPYSRPASPSGSELSEGAASSLGGYASDVLPPTPGMIAKAVVTTGPVAEASANRRTHVAKFECDICGVHLTTKTNLEGHRKSHLGVKEHKCSMCDKYFTRDWDRKRHEKTHAKAELHCHLCGKTSTRKDAFDKHRCRPREEGGPVRH